MIVSMECFGGNRSTPCNDARDRRPGTCLREQGGSDGRRTPGGRPHARRRAERPPRGERRATAGAGGEPPPGPGRRGGRGNGPMITLRRDKERHHDRRRKLEAWLTFDPRDRADALAGGFGALEVLTEDRLAPGAGVPRRPPPDAEIVTYVREGTLAYEDSSGLSGVIPAGEFHRMTAGRGVRHSETNASRTDWAHFFQVWLRPSAAGLAAEDGQRG